MIGFLQTPDGERSMGRLIAFVLLILGSIGFLSGISMLFLDVFLIEENNLGTFSELIFASLGILTLAAGGKVGSKFAETRNGQPHPPRGN